MVRGIVCAALVAFMGVAGSGMAMAQTGSASADPLADFYAGKTMTIIVGSEPGGTYDLYGRTLARHLGKYMPGKPAVIVQNMTGAGSFLAARRVVSVAAQDGLTLGALGAALPYQQLYDPASPPLDIARINWIGSTAAYHMFMLVRGDSLVRTVADLRIHETVQSTIAPGQSNSLIVAVVREALGARIKGINGHKSMNDAMFALQRGEINGYPSAPEEALRRIYGKQLADGDIRLVLQFGPEPLKAYPDVPWAQALAANEDDRNLIELATGFVPEAMQDLAEGRADMHHQKIAAAVPQLPPCDVVMLAQFSMAAAQPLAQQHSSAPVLSSPDCAVLALMKRMHHV
jgi:tripartite-type tricarboxylate transporter receptor subunit TctC